MAIDPNPYLCDICGTHKKETNHWFLGRFEVTNIEGPARHTTEMQTGIKIVMWDAALAISATHLCGIACALKWAGQQLERLSNLV